MLKFAEDYVENGIFHILKKPIDINEVDIDLLVLITNKNSINEKVFHWLYG